MAKATARRVIEPWPKQHKEYSNLCRIKSGPYAMDLTQEEAVAYFPDGYIQGSWESTKDSQSDGIGTLAKQVRSKKELYHFLSIIIRRAWETGEDFDDEDLPWSVEAEEQIHSRMVDTDTETDDLSEWTSEHLASGILDPEAESDMPHLREMIFVAEDTDFSVEESQRLVPRLLKFAEKYRDSNDTQNEGAVWSAIRTGASMLTPDATDCLRPLLEPGHSIETSLVTVKMIGRIFEAQPPAKLDEHESLANEVCPAAEILQNRFAITSSRSAAIAQLAIYALGAMASSKIYGIVKLVRKLNVAWFTQQTVRELHELEDVWANRRTPVAEQPRELLSETIQMLKEDS